MADLESVAKESSPGFVAKRGTSVSERILYGSLALTLVGAHMTIFKDLYDIGMGLMVAGAVIFAGAVRKYLRLIGNSE